MVEINTHKITEQQLMESVLNQYYSGYDSKLTLFVYALAHSWHYKKLIYYLKLLGIK